MHPSSISMSAILAVIVVGHSAGADGVVAPVAEKPIDIGFEIGLEWYVPSQLPMKDGQGFFLALDTGLGPAQIGYRFEALDLTSKADDDGSGIAAEVRYQTQIHEIRVMKPFFDDAIHVGLAGGVAKVHAVMSVNGDADHGTAGTMFDTMAPTGDLFANMSLLTGGRRARAAFNVVTGYRFLRIPGRDPDQNGHNYQTDVSNLSGFHVGISVSAWF